MVSRAVGNKQMVLIVAALIFSLLANVSGILFNGKNGLDTCRDLESLKAPQYAEAKEAKLVIHQYESDYKRIFGSNPTKDPVTGKTLPRWEVEQNKQLRRVEVRLERYAPRECKFLFWRL